MEGGGVLGEGHGKVLVGWCRHQPPAASFVPVAHAGHAHLEQLGWIRFKYVHESKMGEGSVGFTFLLSGNCL